MKTNPSRLHAAATLLLGIIFIHAADMAKAQHIDPATGLPVSQAGDLPPDAVVNVAYSTHNEVAQLIASGKYDEALQRCLSFHKKFKASASLMFLLSDWVELGRRFPKAKESLIEIRDNDVREFPEGRGYSDLFREVSLINRQLGNGDATYALFKTIREKDPELAQQCYFYVEGLLVAKGEHQWCYDHMGDPQGRFGSIRQIFDMGLAHQKRMAEMKQKHGITNSWSPPDTSAMRKKAAEDVFVGQTRQLIEILVATDHKADAEKIRDQAVAVFDDARLHSAVSDAEKKIHHKPVQTQSGFQSGK